MSISVLKKKVVVQTVTAWVLVAVMFGGGAEYLFAAPDGLDIETVASGFALPTDLEFAPDGRIFVAEKGGTVRIIDNGVLLPTPFLTLTDINDFGDRGLISIEIDPDFASNGWVYLSYTYENNPADYEGEKTGRIVRVTADGNTMLPGSMVVLLGTVGGTPEFPSCEDYATTDDCIASDSSSHSVGDLEFGPDGYLYATLGDGARFDVVDPRAERAQDLDNLAGKMLRINRDGTAPADNPYYTGDPTANRSKVWNLGLRNSFRMTFHPQTGIPVTGEVSWFSWEEVNANYKGANQGWPCREGAFETPGYGCEASSTTTDPLYAYQHDAQGAGSVMGGVFMLDPNYPAEFQPSETGAYYLFGDYSQNWIKYMHIHDNGDGTLTGHDVQDFDADPDYPVAFANDANGTAYYSSIFTLPTYAGEIKRIVPSNNKAPTAHIEADATNGGLPLTVNFDGSGSYDPDEDGVIESYDWDFGDGTTSNEINPTHTFTTAGPFTVTLTVTDDENASDTDEFVIFPGNDLPEVTITSPADGSFYEPGDLLEVTAEAFDTEDGALSGDDLFWRVILHHNTHIHIEKQATGTSITLPATDHGDVSVYLEFEVTATDSVGAKKTTSINMYLEGVEPDFELLNLDIADATVEQGDDVEITTTIQNTGGSGQGEALVVIHNDIESLYEEAYPLELITLVTDDLLTTWATDAPLGTYYIDIGTYDSVGAFQHWYWHAGQFDIIENTGGGGTTTPPVGTSTDPFLPSVTEATLTPSPFGVGVEGTVSATIANSGIEGEVDIIAAIHQDNGNIVENVATEVIANNGEITFDTLWTPEEVGTYYFDIGLFEPGGVMYEWNWHYRTIVVEEEAGTSTGTTTPPTGGTSTDPFLPTLTNVELVPNPFGVGTLGTVVATIANSGIEGEVDIVAAIHQDNGNIVENAATEVIANDGEIEFVTNWTPEEEGVYYFDLGLFEPGGVMYEWNWHAFEIVVEAEAGTSTGTTTPPTGTSSDPFLPTLGDLSLVSAPAVVGTPETFSATIENSGVTGEAVVLMTIHQDGENLHVAESLEIIPNSGMVEVTTVWTPEVEGDYYFDLGIFTPDWETMYEWNWHALPFTVGEEDTGTSTGTTTPPTEGTSTDPFLPTYAGVVVSNEPLPVGVQTTFTTTVENSGIEGEAVVLITINDGVENIIVDEHPVTIPNSGVIEVETLWTPTETGTFFYDMGIFTPDWETMYEWNWHAKELLVTEGGSGGTAPDDGLYAEIVATDADVRTINNGTVDLIDFEMVFDLTAVGDTYYLEDTANALSVHFKNSNGDIVGYKRLDQLLTSTADNVNDTFVVESGSTERFTLSASFEATETGFYAMVLDSISFGDFVEGPLDEYQLVTDPKSDFTTSYAAITQVAGDTTGAFGLSYVSLADSSTTFAEGGSYTFAPTVRNTGSAGTGKVEMVITDVTDTTVFSNTATVSFAAGETKTVPQQEWTPVTPGDYSLSLRLISQDEIVEYAAIEDVVTIQVTEDTPVTDPTLTIATAPANPDASTIKVDTEDVTLDVVVFAFTVDAEDAPVSITEIVMDAKTFDASLVNVVSDASLTIGGTSYNAWSYGIDGSSNTDTIVFDLSSTPLALSAGEGVTADVALDLAAKDGNYENGETVELDITQANREAWSVLAADASLVPVGDRRGIANGEEHSLMAEGLFGEIVSTDASPRTINNGIIDVVDFELQFDVTAFDGDFYLAQDFERSLDFSVLQGTEEVTLVGSRLIGALTSVADQTTNDTFLIRDGETETFTFMVTARPQEVGSYRLRLNSLFYNDSFNPPIDRLEHVLRPADDFTTAAAYVAQADETPDPEPTPEVGIVAEVVSTDASVRTINNGTQDAVTFEINFDLTALEEDFYVASSSEYALSYYIEKDGSPFSGVLYVDKSNIPTNLTSNAAKEGVGGFRNFALYDGYTKTFTFTADIAPGETGLYKLVLTDVYFSATNDDGVNDQTLHLEPVEDFTTEAALVSLVEGEEPEPDPEPTPDSNGIFYDNGLPGDIGDWSWGITADFESTGQVYDDEFSILVTPQTVYGGLYLSHVAAIEGITEVFVRIYSEAGNTLSINIYDAAYEEYSRTDAILTAGWNEISVTDLPAGLTGIVIQGVSGEVEAPYYIDEIVVVQ